MPVSAVRYDPFDPEIIDNPFPTYRILRDEHPVYWAAASKTWVLSRHEDVQAALLDHGTYSSVDGIFPRPTESSVMDSFPPMLITMDPPRHDRLRALVSRGFTARRVAALEEGIAHVARELVERLEDGSGTHDFVTDFAAALPVIVIADLLGVPAEHRTRFREWSNHIVQMDPVHGLTADGLSAVGALHAYFVDFIDRRRHLPRDDLMSTLVTATVDGVGLTDEEVLGFCMLLLLAGAETTTNLMSNAVVVLTQNPDSRRRLIADPSLIGSAIEELLRFESPVQGLVRTLSEDLTLHGTAMSRGESVLLLFGSANRDERVFADPDRFDIFRRPDRHLAFGKGIHFCLGAALARMEARNALCELIRRGMDWDVDVEGAERLQSGPIRGYLTLPIAMTPRHRSHREVESTKSITLASMDGRRP